METQTLQNQNQTDQTQITNDQAQLTLMQTHLQAQMAQANALIATLQQSDQLSCRVFSSADTSNNPNASTAG